MRKFGLLALIAPTVIAASVVAAPAFALQAGNSAYPTASSALSAEITSKLDTKNATVGEAVTAKTIAETTLGNGTTVPRGAILTGKVTAVQSKSSGGGTASVTISFDQVMPSKSASPISIHGTLLGVAPKPLHLRGAKRCQSSIRIHEKSDDDCQRNRSKYRTIQWLG